VLNSQAERNGRNTGTVNGMEHSLTGLQQRAVVMLHTLYWIISHVVEGSLSFRIITDHC
jgi:hypothetical protein